ncbi:MAG TPA: pilus assembly protein N-terminal domain-containing protein [Povalibacter sp.]|nr:pilus assembly protein N-terminal domain-containing protein [Povalibacter sp.]
MMLRYAERVVCARGGISLLMLLAALTTQSNADVINTDIAAAPVSVLTVTTGQSLLLRYPGVKRVAVGDGSIVDVKVLDDTQEILLLGKQEGLTDLRIWSRHGTTLAYLINVLAAVKPAPPLVDPLQARRTILIRAKLIEVKKSALRDIGIDWADVAAGPVFGTFSEFVTNPYYRAVPPGVSGLDGLPLELGTSNNYFALTSRADSVIRLLMNNGDARLLAEPTLTCIDGGHADFLVGGEVPIPVQSQDGALNVVFKPFGIILNVEPRTNDTGLIRTKVNVEVSSVDKGIEVLGIPGFATRKTNTEMNVQSGQTMVIAGLFSADDAKTVVKVPGLGQIPVLGEIFKSRQFRRGESELVVLVTPELIGADSAALKSRIEHFDTLKQQSDQALKPKLQD